MKYSEPVLGGVIVCLDAHGSRSRLSTETAFINLGSIATHISALVEGVRGNEARAA